MNWFTRFLFNAWLQDQIEKAKAAGRPFLPLTIPIKSGTVEVDIVIKNY